MGNIVKKILSEVQNQSRLTETINLKAIQDHGVSNRNKHDSIKKHSDMVKILSDPDAWTDDLVFVATNGRKYSIDDLLGKKVKIGSKTLTVEE